MLQWRFGQELTGALGSTAGAKAGQGKWIIGTRFAAGVEPGRIYCWLL